MKLEAQVCSLDLSKRLKELGVTQESMFFWVEAGQKYGDGYGNTAGDLTEEMLVCVAEIQGSRATGNRSSSELRDYKGDIEFDAVHVGEYGDDNYIEYPVSCAAFTVAELGEILKSKVNNISFSERFGWRLFLDIGKEEFADTEADARARCLIYLIENGVVKP